MRCPVTVPVAAGTVAAIIGCTAAPRQSDQESVLGEWNGPHVSLVLTDSGGTIEYDCGSGKLRAPAQLDASGGFVVPGVHIREHGGPVRVGEVPDSLPARYVGRLRGGQMTLRVFVSSDTLGSFTLRRGATQQLVKCL